MRTTITTALIALLGIVCLSTAIQAWGPQGHRLVAMIAGTYLTGNARQNISWLLGTQTLADVATWADKYLDDNVQTAAWHYVNIPALATAYDRTRDCPVQPRPSSGIDGDRWRDCVVDRILYNQQRLADASLDRADRAIALKFLVHFVADLHQPFHAIGIERGGNGIQVIAFGSTDCSTGAQSSRGCNLHGIWDSGLIERRKLGDLQYLTALQQLIRTRRLDREPIGTPAEWAMESHAIAKKALVPPFGKIDDSYYASYIGIVDRRLASAGLRLAAMLNRNLSSPPPRQSN
jgi:hypothetical protein